MGINVGKVEIVERADGKFHFRAVALNGERICVSEPYSSASNAVRGWNDLRAFAYGNPRVVEVGREVEAPAAPPEAPPAPPHD